MQDPNFQKDPYTTIGDVVKNSGDWVIYRAEVQTETPAPAGQKTAPTINKQTTNIGPANKANIDSQIEAAKAQKVTVNILNTYPVSFYANANGDLILVAEGDVPDRLTARPSPPLMYYPVDLATFKVDTREQRYAHTGLAILQPVSYTHLTLPTICSV